MPKKLNFLFITFALITKLAFAEPETSYVPGIDDLPVPINFSLEEDSDSIFDDESGRLIEATFKGRGTKEQIIDFYDKTLEALGWKKLSILKYERSDEILTITTLDIQDSEFHNIEISFSLKPKN